MRTGAGGKICSERKNEESNGIVRVGGRNFRAVENAQKNAVALGKGYRKQTATKKIIILDKRA